MKRILAILSLALAGAAAPVFAADYYDTYANPTVETSTSSQWIPEWNRSASYTYETTTYQNYQVIRSSYMDQGLWHDSYYKFRITGDNVDLYITDYLDTIDGNPNTGVSNNNDALKNKGITQIGYRYLDSSDAANIGKTVSTGLDVAPNSAANYVFAQDTQNNWQQTMVEGVTLDTIDTDRYKNAYVVTRNQYYLGNFKEGDEIEIYLQANGYGEAWSNTTNYMGGYGNGVTDASDRLASYQLGLSWDETRKAAPLASLDVGNGHRVFYGVYGQAAASGAPLPGGAALYVIAGLFTIGFIVVRRRKAVAA